MLQMNLSKAEIAALQYLSVHRGEAVIVGKHISLIIFRRMQKKKLLMWANEKRMTCIMTAEGERTLKRL